MPNSSGAICPLKSNAPPNLSVSTFKELGILLHATEALQPRTIRYRLLHRPIRHRSGILLSGTLTPLRRQLSHTLIP